LSEIHPWVILFDIDGTLLTVDHSFNRPLLRNIIDDLGIKYPDMEKDAFSGRTDYDIMSSFLVHHDNEEELFERFKAEYLRRLGEEINENHVLRHDHVDEAIAFFSSPDFIPGLLTGNFPDAAVFKLNAARIELDYQIGAFGDRHKDRNKLPYLAMASLEEMMNTEPDPQRFVIIGDTPRDIQCAQHAGMKCVAVTTGSYSRDELQEYDPDLILDDLSQAEKWFGILTNDR